MHPVNRGGGKGSGRAPPFALLLESALAATACISAETNLPYSCEA